MRTRFIGDAALCRQWYGYALNRYRALGNSQSCILRPDIGVEIILRKENDLVGEIRITAQKEGYYSTQYLYIDIGIYLNPQGYYVNSWKLVVALVDSAHKVSPVKVLELPLIDSSYRVGEEILATTFDLANPKDIYFLAKERASTIVITHPLQDETAISRHKYKLYKTTIDKNEDGNLYLTDPQLVDEFIHEWGHVIHTYYHYIDHWNWYISYSENIKIKIRDLYINGNVFKYLYEYKREVEHHTLEANQRVAKGPATYEIGYVYEDVGTFSCSAPYWYLSGETAASENAEDPDDCVSCVLCGIPVTLCGFNDEAWVFNHQELSDGEIFPLCALNENDYLVAKANSDPIYTLYTCYHNISWIGNLSADSVLTPHPPFSFCVYSNDSQYSHKILYKEDTPTESWEAFKKSPLWALHLYEHTYSVAIKDTSEHSDADLNFFTGSFVGFLQSKKTDPPTEKSMILRGALLEYYSFYFINATKQTTWSIDIQHEPVYSLHTTFRKLRIDIDEGKIHVNGIAPDQFIADIVFLDKRNNTYRCNGKPVSIGGNNNGT